MTTVNNVGSDALAAAKGASSKKTGAEEAQDRFMTLLVTQMKNQDPLNPLDNAQVTSQMAQLSTVTGIDKLNATMENLLSGFQSTQSLQAAGMIGRAVLVPGESLNLVEGQAVFGVELEAPADKVTVKIRDAEGTVLHVTEMEQAKAGVLPLTWDGKMANGESAPNGNYKIEAVATIGGQTVKPKALTFGEVVSVSVGAQGVKLNLLGVGEASMADVRQIL